MDFETLPSYVNKEMFHRMYGIYVHETRETLEISLEELTSRTNIPVKRLKSIEKGKSNLKPATIQKLNLALNLDPLHLERIYKVARVGYVDELLTLLKTDVAALDLGEEHNDLSPV